MGKDINSYSKLFEHIRFESYPFGKRFRPLTDNQDFGSYETGDGRIIKSKRKSLKTVKSRNSTTTNDTTDNDDNETVYTYKTNETRKTTTKSKSKSSKNKNSKSSNLMRGSNLGLFKKKNINIDQEIPSYLWGVKISNMDLVYLEIASRNPKSYATRRRFEPALANSELLSDAAKAYVKARESNNFIDIYNNLIDDEKGRAILQKNFSTSNISNNINNNSTNQMKRRGSILGRRKSSTGRRNSKLLSFKSSKSLKNISSNTSSKNLVTDPQVTLIENKNRKIVDEDDSSDDELYNDISSSPNFNHTIHE